jgi:hypothetical protein
MRRARSKSAANRSAYSLSRCSWGDRTPQPGQASRSVSRQLRERVKIGWTGAALVNRQLLRKPVLGDFI